MVAQKSNATKEIRDFSIPKSPKAVSVRVLLTIAAGEIVFGLFVFLIIILRDALQADLTFALFFWIGFTGKALLVLSAVYKDIDSWSGVQYYTSGKTLVTSVSSHGSTKTTMRKLSDLAKVSVLKPKLGNKLNFGNIVLVFTEGAFSESVVLSDIDNPTRMANLIERKASIK